MDIGFSDLLTLAPAVFLIAALYATIGHGGASGYIAAMVWVGVAPVVLKPTALSLNLLVSVVGTLCFLRAGHFRWHLFWPFALTSVPASFLGGYVSLPLHAYKVLLGVLLFVSAYRLLPGSSKPAEITSPPRVPVALGAGTLIGVASGLTGVGGGIFLSPLLVLMGWARAKEASAVSAPFILVNSAAGLFGFLCRHQGVHEPSLALLAAALVGGVAGSYLGCYRLPRAVIVRTLSLVLFTAGAKMVLT
jgi:hypothetical protein